MMIDWAATLGRKAPASVGARREGEAALLVFEALGAATDWRVGKAVRSAREGGGAVAAGIGEGNVPFFGMIYPVSLVLWWVTPLEHLIYQRQTVIQASDKSRRWGGKFGGLSSGCERVEVGRERSPQAGHDEIGTAVPNCGERMIDNDSVGGFHDYEISIRSEYGREGILDIFRERTVVLKEIFIIQVSAGETKGLDDRVVRPNDPPRKGTMRCNWRFEIPLREGSHEVVEQRRLSMLEREVGFV